MGRERERKKRGSILRKEREEMGEDMGKREWYGKGERRGKYIEKEEDIGIREGKGKRERRRRDEKGEREKGREGTGKWKE